MRWTTSPRKNAQNVILRFSSRELFQRITGTAPEIEYPNYLETGKY